MAEGRGGYRRPESPAPVSGPGALSQRTDGQGAKYMAGGEYGEGQEMMDLQTSAPMSSSQPRPRPRGGREAGMPASAMPTPLFAPSERPDEPLTAGAPFGAGPGPDEGLAMAKPVNNLEVVTKYLPVLQKVATYDGAPERFRALVRYLHGAM